MMPFSSAVGPRGQAVGPDGGGGGDQAEVHRDGQVGGECVHIGQILFQLVHVRLIHPVDEVSFLPK